MDKPVKLEPGGTISPPTTFQPSTTRKEPTLAAIEQYLLAANPETPNVPGHCPLPSVPEEQYQ